MEKQLIMFESITHAIKARDVLRNSGILTHLERTPMNLKVTSCGYSLYVPDNIEKAAEILNKHRIRYLGIGNSDAL